MGSRDEFRNAIQSVDEDAAIALFARTDDGVDGLLEDGKQPPHAHVDILGAYLAWVAEMTDLPLEAISDRILESAEEAEENGFLAGERR
ncbi:hypothetical protein MBEHAL_1141 [Halarchaeum acidiphilum MH1-52-1]|uniref:Uncharacterized protein n=1 Tax=Halarchaeum acidiphilum MH1-52-1 TaxID=1261545 RepID=U2YEU4_9EURY|nr:hypothetical protein [Halarchaeum acidiphilum]GAD52381.1 hypothetical protein MBEHAL_1141 [Halarchaeum acidiphilum MH1-52-1]